MGFLELFEKIRFMLCSLVFAITEQHWVPCNGVTSHAATPPLRLQNDIGFHVMVPHLTQQRHRCDYRTTLGSM